MQYVLTENKRVILGPMNWKPRFIQSELNDLEVVYTVPPVEQGYIKIDDTYEIFPISGVDEPVHDKSFEQLAGPFYTFTADSASITHTVQDQEITAVKNALKALAASERYKKEVAGTKVTVQGIEVTVDTGREARNMFVQQFTLMGTNDTTQWKFPEVWLTLSKTDLGNIVAAGVTYIQNQFDWEKTIIDQIDVATDLTQLKPIVIAQPKPNLGA